MSGGQFGLWAALACLPWLLAPASARAKDDGIAVEDCTGCHSGSSDKGASVSISASPSTLAPGQTVRLSVSVSGGSAAGLFFRTTPNVGTLSVVAGQSTKLAAGGIVHASPRAAANQTTTFAIDWKAPNQPGDVELFAYAIAANGDGGSTGDGYGSAYLSLVFGCSGTTYYADYDLDGYGGMLANPRLACSPPPSFSAQMGDCDDYDAKRNPGASELCNGKDDDCDGQLDDNVVYAEYCEDKDGDGHGVRGGATKMDCGPRDGFGLCDNDCADSDPKVYPGATEACNYKDDNCNNRVDENARATCGEGWCRRSSESCSVNLCTPGEPVAEECNALDDDCDGVVDDGDALCPARQICHEGSCVPAGSALDAGVRDAGSHPDAEVPRASDGATTAGPGSGASGGCAVASGRPANALLVALALLLQSCMRYPAKRARVRAKSA